MTFDEFKGSLEEKSPPKELSPELKALWLDGKGEWGKAHRLAQNIEGTEAAWVHAYLHRREGDEGNAGYWYSRAGRKFCNLTLEEEWEQIVKALLDAGNED